MSAIVGTANALFLKGFSEKYFTHAVGYPFEDSFFYKDFTQAVGLLQTSNLPQEAL